MQTWGYDNGEGWVVEVSMVIILTLWSPQALRKMAAQAMAAFNKLDSWLKSSEKKKRFQGKAKEGNGEMIHKTTQKSIFGFLK